jgi:hypothetical protein
MLPESFLKKIQNVDYEAYVKALEIKKEISSYISDLPAFAKRVLKDCFGIPLEILNPRTTEQLLFFSYLKKDDIKKCYSYITKDYKFYGLKKNLTIAEYEKLIDDLAYLGMLANKIFKFEEQFGVINQYKLKPEFVSFKEKDESEEDEEGKNNSENSNWLKQIIETWLNKSSKNTIIFIFLFLFLLLIIIFLFSRKNINKEYSSKVTNLQVTNLTEIPFKELKNKY